MFTLAVICAGGYKKLILVRTIIKYDGLGYTPLYDLVAGCVCRLLQWLHDPARHREICLNQADPYTVACSATVGNYSGISRHLLGFILVKILVHLWPQVFQEIIL